MFARRTDWEFNLNKITERREQLQSNRQDVLDLTESNPTRCGFSYLEETGLRALSSSENRDYAPAPQGLLSARESICRYYAGKGISVTPEQIFLTASTSEAYTFLFRLLANPGEKVCFPRPSYPLFPFLVDLNDLQMISYPLTYDAGWRIDQAALDVCADARALVLVNPNNPTGHFIKPQELAAVNTICRDRGLAVIADEVFFDYAFDGERKVTLTGNDEVLTFSLGGLSKALGMPQMKVAWIVVSGPADLVGPARERLEVIADTYLSVNTPSQQALSGWLAGQPQIRSEIFERVKRNRGWVEQVVTSGAAACLAAEGGWYAILKLNTCDEESFVLDLLEQDHVFVHPGYFFDMDGSHIVLSLLPQEPLFKEGLKRIQSRLQAYARK